ncbi:unnamed protein product [Urochloa decumbens]|uniref:Bifunctional inhibitor/plant lipid transfer protein/seed storage helical domain-containing protein n=1 Tax=Urochloa decumbens TaxID=240449 RepID=A0ABC9FEZ9_9POAL
MMGIRVIILQILVFTLVFTMFTKHQASGEPECYAQKESVMYQCRETLKHTGRYEHPTDSCRRVVRRSDLACICGIFSIEDEARISIGRFLQLASECGKPVTGVPKCGSYTMPQPRSPRPPRA